MKKKKNYIKIFGLSILVFIGFSFFLNITTVIAYYEYQNPDGLQTQICGFANTDIASCNARVKTECGATTTGSCVSSLVNCNSSMATTIICPTPDVQSVTGITTPDASNTYTLLAPIGGMTTAPTNIGDYFNKIFLIAIGLCGALAVIMIVIGGVQYMGDESIFGKTKAKDQITNAILGLLIALASYVLLNTINPDLLGKGVHIQQVSAVIINLPDAGDSSVDQNFKTGTGSYSLGSISPGVTSAVAKLQQGWTISGFQLNSANNTMAISLKNGSSVDTNNVISIAHGEKGYAEVGQAGTGDRKTPKGTWTILSMTTPGNGVPIYNATGSNMGASYWLLSAMTSGERGIGIHGSQSGTINGATAGCIRLTNADLLALLPYIKTGLQVVVN